VRVEDRAPAPSGELWYWAYRAAALGASWTGPRTGQAVAGVIGGLFHRLSPDRRAIRARHLQRAMGRPLARGELEELLAVSLRWYGRYWMEVLSAGTKDRDFWRTALDFEGLEHLSRPLEEGRGCVLALAHLGNWDTAGAWVVAQGWKLSSVAEVLQPPRLFELFCDIRHAMGMTIYPLDRSSTAARGLLRDLQANSVVALLADRDLTGDGVEVEFFSERTTVPGGPAALALRSGAPLVPTGLYPKEGGRYQAVLLPPVEAGLHGRKGVATMTQELTRRLEHLIRRGPEHWHLYQPNWPSDRRAAKSTLVAGVNRAHGSGV
jgi:phosphatidylinositol dimannoside acyltransferase